MPCTCGHSGTTRTLQGSRRQVLNIDSLRKAPAQSSRKCRHQLPRPACQQNTVRAGYRSASAKHTETLTLCRAQKQDEQEKDMVGGFDVDSEPGFLESEAVGIVFKIGFVAFVSAGVAAILLLARPVIDNTIKAFPYRTSGGSQQGGSPDVKSLIPGLDSGDSQGAEDSIF